MTLAIHADSMIDELSTELRSGLEEMEESTDLVNGFLFKTRLKTIHVAVAFVKSLPSEENKNQWVKKAFTQRAWCHPTLNPPYSKDDAIERIQKAIQEILSSKKLGPELSLTRCRVSIELLHPGWFSTYEGKEICNLFFQPPQVSERA